MKTFVLSLFLLFTPVLAAAQEPIFPGDQILAILHQTADDCPRAWSNAHKRDTGEQFDFVIEAVKRLYAASGGTVGGNWRVGRVGDLSMDGITVKATDGRFYFSDIIVAAGSKDARLTFGISAGSLLRDGAGNYIGERGFVPASELPAPKVACDAAPPPAPEPPPQPQPPAPPAVDLRDLIAAVQTLSVKVDALTVQVTALQGDLMDREYVVSSIEHFNAVLGGIVSELADRGAQNRMLIETSNRLEQLLANPPELKGRVFGLPITLRPERP